jgi:hypothetical protein
MKKGIRAADIIIICLSPSFDKKPPVSWVKKELKMAMLKERETGKSILIPVRIKSGGTIPEEIGTKAYAGLSTKSRWIKNLPAGSFHFPGRNQPPGIGQQHYF